MTSLRIETVSASVEPLSAFWSTIATHPVSTVLAAEAGWGVWTAVGAAETWRPRDVIKKVRSVISDPKFREAAGAAAFGSLLAAFVVGWSGFVASQGLFTFGSQPHYRDNLSEDFGWGLGALALAAGLACFNGMVPDLMANGARRALAAGG